MRESSVTVRTYQVKPNTQFYISFMTLVELKEKYAGQVATHPVEHQWGKCPEAQVF